MSGSADGILRRAKNGYELWIIQVVRSNNEHESSIGCSDGFWNGNSNRMRPDRIVRPVLCGKQNEIKVGSGIFSSPPPVSAKSSNSSAQDRV